MDTIIPDYRLAIDIINLFLAIAAGTIAISFFRKNKGKISGGAGFLIGSFFFIVFFEFLEFYNALFAAENFIIKSALMFTILILIIFGIRMEAKEFKKAQSPYEIVFEKK